MGVAELAKVISLTLFAKITSADWTDVLEKLTSVLKQPRQEKIIIFIDELQWLVSQKTTLISLLKKYLVLHLKITV